MVAPTRFTPSRHLDFLRLVPHNKNMTNQELRKYIKADESVGPRLADATSDAAALDVAFTICRVLGETIQRDIGLMSMGDKSHWASILVDVYTSKQTIPETTQGYAKCILRRFFWGEFAMTGDGFTTQKH